MKLAAGVAVGLPALLLGVSYLGLGTRLFLKRRGRLHPVTIVLFWPYLLLNWVLWHPLRFFGEPYAEVQPGLFVGRRLLAHEPCPCDAVLDLTCEFNEPKPFREREAYLCLPVLDGVAPTRAQVEAALLFIASHESVYVHCAMGHGRSATVVIAQLLATGEEKDVSAAEQRLKRVRPGTRLRPGQRRLLRTLAESA